MNQVRAVNVMFRRALDGRLTVNDCRVLVCAFTLQALALAAVRYLSIPRARRALSWLRPMAVVFSGRPPEQRVIWALQASERWLPGSSTCLGRALGAELLIEAVDGPVTVVIGVAAPIAGRVRSHAWIERGGRVLLGGDGSPRQYVPLVTWHSATP